MTQLATPGTRPAPPPARRTGAADVFFAALRLVGELAITFGVVVLLFVVYEVFFTNVVQEHSQNRLRASLQQQWQAPAPTSGPAAGTAPAPLTVSEGTAFALLKVPRLGAGYEQAVVEGVTHADLKLGPGHYPGTPLPGAVGNMVISGHRTTYGAPFRRMDELKVGDPLVVETRTTDYTYRLLRTQVVLPSATEVLLPVPGKPGVRPTQRLLTLTTCNPPFSAKQRLVLVAELTGTSKRGS